MSKLKLTSLLLLTWATGAFSLEASSAMDDEKDMRRSRLMVPDFVSCERNNLTSFSGKPTKYNRENGELEITIATDFDTVETITVGYPSSTALMESFFIKGKAVDLKSWQEFEESVGILSGKISVTAWVCNLEGIAPVFVWKVNN